MKLGFLLVIAVTCTCASADILYDIDLGKHLEHFTKHRYPSPKHTEEHEKARKYIKDTMNYHGLIVETQEFNTSVNTLIRDFEPMDEIVTGVNIIGIAPAKSDKAEAVVVVMADYDTNGVDNPMMNNGAGVSVLLEAARLFMFNVRWGRMFSQDYTTLFVAVDINTKEHLLSGGKPGGWYFVNEWLWNYLNQSDINFGGAYVIDSVMNLNTELNSQDADESFKNTFPETYDRVMESGFAGTFLSMVTWETEKTLKLKEQYMGSYNKERVKRIYRLEDMTFPKSLSVSKVLLSFTKQESFHFWTFNHHNESHPLPALLLTDTESLRKVPMMDNCTDICQLTSERNKFMSSTTLALIRTLLNRQAHPIDRSASSLVVSIPALVIVMAITLLIKKID